MNNQFNAQSLNRKSHRKFTLSYFRVTCFKHVGLLWPISALDRKQVRGYWIYLEWPLSSNGNIFRVTGHFCGEFTGPQRRGTLMFSLICAWINGWVNNRETGDFRRHGAHYDVTVVSFTLIGNLQKSNHYRLIRELWNSMTWEISMRKVSQMI